MSRGDLAEQIMADLAGLARGMRVLAAVTTRDRRLRTA
jgi:hypothetical protein